MKWFAILFVFFSLTIHAGTKAQLDLSAQIYNEKIKTVDGLINLVKLHDESKAKALKDRFTQLKISGGTNLPELIVVDNYLTFKNFKGSELKITPLDNGGIRIEFEGKSFNYNITMDINDIEKAFTVSKKTSMMDFVISKAVADDLARTFGLLNGGHTGFDLTSAVYGAANAVEEMHMSFKKWRNKGLYEDADEACTDVQEGKVVKNSQKLVEKLKQARKDEECVSHWPAKNPGSCKFFDLKIECLSGATDSVNNNARSAKPGTYNETYRPASNGKSK